MGKRRRMKAHGLDGEGNIRFTRDLSHTDREQAKREAPPARTLFQRMLVREQIRDENREVRTTLGLNVR